MAGLMSLFGRAPDGHATEGGGQAADRYAGALPKHRAYFAHGGHTGAGAHGRYFAHGGMADPEDEGGEVTPELKLAAYELLECLDSSRFGGSDGKTSRAEAFAKAMLAFVRLADEMPHAEGEHGAEEGGEKGEPE